MGRKHGLNLTAQLLNYDDSAAAFADLIRGAGTDNGFQQAQPGHANPGYQANRWPNRVDSMTGPTQIVVALNRYLLAGLYTLRAAGVGTITIDGGFNGVPLLAISFDGSGAPRFATWPSNGLHHNRQITLVITASDVNNPLRDLRFYIPGHDGELWNRRYLAQFEGAHSFRWMDMGRTNSSTVSTWSQSFGAAGYSFHQRGRVHEAYAQSLANATGCAPWYCQPALVTEDYQAGFTDMVLNGITIDGLAIPPLNADLPIYGEHSNETWHLGAASFGQGAQHQAMYNAAGSQRYAWQLANPSYGPLGFNEFVAHRKSYWGRRQKALLAAGGRANFKVALMSQEGSPDTGRLELLHYGLPNLYDGVAGSKPDLFGCGHYYQANGNMDSLAALHATNPTAALDQLFATMPANINYWIGFLGQYERMAADAGIPFGIYEFGPDVNAFNKPAWQALVVAASLDPRMGQMATLNYSLMPADIEVAQYFLDIWTPGEFVWGLRSHGHQTTSPKWAAWRAELGGSAPPPPAPPARVARRYPRGLMRLR